MDGQTLVVHGMDYTAKPRQEFGTLVWKSTDDGETWTDETGDLVSMSPGHGVRYESDFYLKTFGEALPLKHATLNDFAPIDSGCVDVCACKCKCMVLKLEEMERRLR